MTDFDDYGGDTTKSTVRDGLTITNPNSLTHLYNRPKIFLPVKKSIMLRHTADCMHNEEIMGIYYPEKFQDSISLDYNGYANGIFEDQLVENQIVWD